MTTSGEEFLHFWKSRIESNKGTGLLIAGLGFDPRTSRVLSALQSAGWAGHLDVSLLAFDEGEGSASHQYKSLVEENRGVVSAMVATLGGRLTELAVPLTWEGRRIGGRRIGGIVSGYLTGRSYDDIIVDISALPKTLYFPLLRHLLGHCSEYSTNLTNLHVALYESPDLDARIKEELTERADFLPGFAGTVELEQDWDVPRIWAPVLGEGQVEALKRVEQKLSAAGERPEVCPILPFPAVRARRGDELVLEYADVFKAWDVDLRNVLYASEHNPFDIYRQLCRLYDRYTAALSPLRGAKMIVSAHSSKLLSFGVFLAAHDRQDMAVAQVEALGYTIDTAAIESYDGCFHSAWIAGEPYV